MPPKMKKPTFSLSIQFHTPLRSSQHCQRRPPNSKPFSSTPQNDTRLRQAMFRWLRGPGAVFKDPLPGSTNYLNAYDASGRLLRLGTETRMNKDDEDDGPALKEGEEKEEGEAEQNLAMGVPTRKEMADDFIPFPLNRQFKSESVLSEELREEIWDRVTNQGKSARMVSAELGVEMSRVGAVVRLKTVEKAWLKQGKPLATPYARAILSMLPVTPFIPNTPITPHESINDLPVHRSTLNQIFHPVSESRQFTRVDAASVFKTGLLPADDRIPHPELIEVEREKNAQISREERITRQGERERKESEAKLEKQRRRREREERAMTRVVPEGSRWEFRFQEVSVESVGRDGRDLRGVGARYGIPHEDRKRGQIKIPKKVDG
ncbi:MAG: hypothetical protein MMC33_004368 [Icmadophila ericetorum]|nr:hypothetical protein [Icmadophila ericetorum]